MSSSRFRKNFLAIAKSNAFSQALSLLALPILARLFSPESFGVLTAYTIMLSFVIGVSTLRFDWLIPNSRNMYRVRLIVAASVYSVAAFTLLTIILSILFKSWLVDALKLHGNELILTLVPFGVAAGGLQLILQSKYVYDGDLIRVARAKIWQITSTTSTSLIFGFWLFGDSGFALALAYLFGFIASVITLSLYQGNFLLSSARVRVRKLVPLFRKYKTQLGYATTLSAINVSMAMCLAGLILFYYSPKEVGWYGLVFRAATAPIGIISNALAQSFWAEAADLAKTDPKKLRHIYLKTTIRLVYVAIPIGAIALLGPLYVPLIFGPDEWDGAGKILAAVSPYLIGMVAFSPTTHLVVYQRMGFQLACDLATLFCTIIVFSVVALNGGDVWTSTFAASTTLFTGYVVRFQLHLYANKLHIKQTLKPND